MTGPTLEPVKSTRIYEEIVRQIRVLIADGQLKSRDRLPPERDLAERFRVSRASVREALRTLENMGLIEIRAGEGTFVRAASEALVEPLAQVILSQREAIADLYEARGLLEPAIAALAARRATREEVAEMERILDAQGREVEQGGTGLAHDAAFHAALAHSTHNQAVARITGTLVDLLAQTREEALQTRDRPRRSHEDHRRILEAIRARDPEAACEAMLRHLEGVQHLEMGRGPDDPRGGASGRAVGRA